MILSLLLRGTLLLLAANHSIAQEWYVQDNGPDYYAAPSVVQDTQPSFLEKRQAESSANESKTVYLSDHHVTNVRQKRQTDDADNEQRSSDVTEYASNDVSDHVDDHVSEEKDQSIDRNSSLDMNGYSVTNNSYEYTHRDTNTSYDFVDSKQSGFNGNEETGKTLEDTATNTDNDVMDEADEPTSDHTERSKTKSAGNQGQQDGSGKSYYQEDDKNAPINKVENINKQERENTTEPEESDQQDNVVGKEKQEKKTTTNLGEDGSGEEVKDDEWLRGDDDEDEDEAEQPVKRQNLAWGAPRQQYSYSTLPCCPANMICPETTA